MTQHRLDDSNVHAVRQQATGAFVTKIVPVQVNLAELGTINASAWFRAFRVVAVRDEQQ